MRALSPEELAMARNAYVALNEAVDECVAVAAEQLFGEFEPALRMMSIARGIRGSLPPGGIATLCAVAVMRLAAQD